MFAVGALPVEAAAPARVAGRATVLVHFQEDRVGVAVDEHAAHVLMVAGLFAFAPQAAAAAPVDGAPGAQRLAQRLFVHVSEHQHLARVRILSDDRNEAASLVEVDLELFHG